MNRRFFLRGLVASPAVVAASSLMPVRGIIMPVNPVLPVFDSADVVWTATGGMPNEWSMMAVYDDNGLISIVCKDGFRMGSLKIPSSGIQAS